MRLVRHSQTKLALGSDATIELVSDHSNKAIADIFDELWRYIFRFERSFSRFIPMSELSQLNRSAGLEFAITSEFEDLLRIAKELGERTGGLYNPFILPALQRSGYKKSAVPGYEQDPVDDYSGRKVTTIDKLEIGDGWAQIPHSTALDMGGCGKGYLADKLSGVLAGLGISNFRLSFGGDIATRGTDENDQRWIINIQDADNLSGEVDRIVRCPVESFAIATSGTFRRLTQTANWDWHHIIDPVTLRPATTDIRLATVCTNRAVEADVLASCAIITGSVKATAFLKKHGVSSTLIQAQNDTGIFVKCSGRDIIKLSVKEGS